ncbi:hypothetical protein GGX14DRAFT_396576 [Mycena pura]|uniref:Uncharacterized protein n=1 Tax=Mycena pura TaxID=153505 RepID=A0AAD6VAL3_9AGAR|nr:hypothetical protein GGX14DRAFT_396576 [Mycena pura]
MYGYGSAVPVPVQVVRSAATVRYGQKYGTTFGVSVPKVRSVRPVYGRTCTAAYGYGQGRTRTVHNAGKGRTVRVRVDPYPYPYTVLYGTVTIPTTMLPYLSNQGYQVASQAYANYSSY